MTKKKEEDGKRAKAKAEKLSSKDLDKVDGGALNRTRGTFNPIEPEHS